MKLNLEKRRALVFGASSGIGFGIAKSLLAEGVQTAISARPGERLNKAASELVGAWAVGCDLSQAGQAAQTVEQVIRRWGGLDILVLNTGGPPKGTFEEITQEGWQTGFQSLWLSSVEAIRAALDGMKKNRLGRIIFLTSLAAKEPIPGLTVSNGIRAGLLGLVKSLNNDVAEFGITVNAIMPGFIDTDRLKELKIDSKEILSSIPARRLGSTQDVGNLAAFLASDAASYVSGQSIACDGGRQRGY